jgi:hypothetical protein
LAISYFGAQLNRLEEFSGLFSNIWDKYAVDGSNINIRILITS